jgi:hypothetical protein
MEINFFIIINIYGFKQQIVCKYISLKFYFGIKIVKVELITLEL